MKTLIRIAISIICAVVIVGAVIGFVIILAEMPTLVLIGVAVFIALIGVGLAVYHVLGDSQ